MKTNKLFGVKTVAAAIIAVLSLCIPVIFTPKSQSAASVNYYVCFSKDEYRVRDNNKMKTAGDGYRLTATLAQGDKFFVTDDDGNMYGASGGGLCTVREAGTKKYTIRFDSVTKKTSYEPYRPSDVKLNVAGTATDMIFRSVNAAFDEYVLSLYIESGSKLFAENVSTGVSYDKEGVLAGDGYTVTVGGYYRVLFTADPDNLYGDDGNEYIKIESAPELFALVGGNEFSKTEEARLTRDEQRATEQYIFESDGALGVKTKKRDEEVEFGVLSDDDGKKYYPNDEHKVKVKDVGSYRIVCAAAADGYRVSLEKREAYYDGYYLMGDVNDWTFVESGAGKREFDSAYKFIKDDSVKDYDEYSLTYTLTESELAEQNGEAHFYITDGTAIFRKPIGGNIILDEAGEYEFTFSPAHDYGRGYRYRYERVADKPARDTVYISTADEFMAFAEKCTAPEFSLNKAVIIKNDLDFSGKEFKPMAAFAGELDGAFHSFKGITLHSDGGSAYLINKLAADGKITRLGLDIDISGGDYVAPVAQNYGAIEDVTVTGKVEGDSYAGGVAAANYGGALIKNCVASVAVTGTLNAGGICGFNAGSVENSENNGNVNAQIFSASKTRGMLNIGGVCGYSTGKIFDCVNRGEVGRDQARFFGGIAGLCSGGVYFCDNYGNVGGQSDVGGIIGWYGRFDSSNNNNPLNQYLAGTEYEKWLDEYFGTGNGNFEESADSGIRDVYYCYNAANVCAESNAGGIIGGGDATGLMVLGCASSGEITANTDNAGGIAGSIGTGEIRQCVMLGYVAAKKGECAGGIAGISGGGIFGCVAGGYVEAEKGYAGGIVGNGATVGTCVSHCYVQKTGGAHFGVIAGVAKAYYNNFFPSAMYGLEEDVVLGIDGVNYGSENNYGACELDRDKILCEGTLSPYLYGLPAADFLAGESEKRYPVPRCFTDMVTPDSMASEPAKLSSAFDKQRELYKTAGDAGKLTVSVVFFEYDFDGEKYTPLKTYYIPVGGSVTAPEVPQKDGYFTWWSDAKLTDVTQNTEVKMLYHEYVTSIATDEQKPRIIVTGKFHSDARLVVQTEDGYTSLKFMRGEEQTDYGKVTVRYAVDDGDYKVIVAFDGKSIEPQFTVDAGYIVFELDGNAEFKVEKVTKPVSVALICSLSCLGGAVFVAAVVFVVWLVTVKKRKKRAAQSGENTDGDEAGNNSDVQSAEK